MFILIRMSFAICIFLFQDVVTRIDDLRKFCDAQFLREKIARCYVRTCVFTLVHWCNIREECEWNMRFHKSQNAMVLRKIFRVWFRNEQIGLTAWGKNVVYNQMSDETHNGYFIWHLVKPTKFFFLRVSNCVMRFTEIILYDTTIIFCVSFWRNLVMSDLIFRISSQCPMLLVWRSRSSNSFPTLCHWHLMNE